MSPTLRAIRHTAMIQRLVKNAVTSAAGSVRISGYAAIICCLRDEQAPSCAGAAAGGASARMKVGHS